MNEGFINLCSKEIVYIEHEGRFGFSPFNLCIGVIKGTKLISLEVNTFSEVVEALQFHLCTTCDQTTYRYLALDYDPKPGITSEFVGIVSYVNNNMSACAVPYIQTGKILKVVSGVAWLQNLANKVKHLI